MNSSMTPNEQEKLIEKLDIFKIHGRDKRGFKVLRITGKFFTARFLNVNTLTSYLEENIFPRLGKKPFSVVYVHTGVQRSENFPGISALRSIYDAIPTNVRDNLQAVYFLHPGLQARLFLATFGRLLFGGGLYGKLRYVSSLDYLWEHVRRNEVEIPEFVYDHDEDLEYLPMMDYGLMSAFSQHNWLLFNIKFHVHIHTVLTLNKKNCFKISSLQPLHFRRLFFSLFGERFCGVFELLCFRLSAVNKL